MIVFIAVGQRVLGQCRADLFREDLATEGVGTGRHGFALDLLAGCLSPREGYEISVRRLGDGVALPGSPYVLKPMIRLLPEH
ncbi:hypothetical protein FV228_15770 [Methylobacterium sp. WL18]|uniref:hypothetical protein n=1 Tax=Methylobacterium sp. WL18 TaxID=2603897 RepID=UPI0011CB5B63|nr:hypothetical protein [Methylobacterium sp. WL18]TXN65411.1 hypothetical protein FV228_15770 [Methylobacterium sp. WL18]